MFIGFACCCSETRFVRGAVIPFPILIEMPVGTRFQQRPSFSTHVGHLFRHDNNTVYTK